LNALGIEVWTFPLAILGLQKQLGFSVQIALEDGPRVNVDLRTSKYRTIISAFGTG